MYCTKIIVVVRWQVNRLRVCRRYALQRHVNFARASMYSMHVYEECATKLFTQALRLKPGDAKLLTNRVTCYLKRGKVNMALRYAQRCTAVHVQQACNRK